MCHIRSRNLADYFERILGPYLNSVSRSEAHWAMLGSAVQVGATTVEEEGGNDGAGHYHLR
jgi:hypothetical protein